MISRDLGFCRYWIMDSSFGTVTAGEKNFNDRFKPFFLPEKIVWMDQQHTDHIEVVENIPEDGIMFPKTDGVFTHTRRALLVTKTADCVPIILWNEKLQTIGVLHCGWRGFFKGILEAFLSLCQEKNWQISSFEAFLGPHLRVQNFQVEKDFIDQIPSQKKKFLIEKDGQFFFDLSRAVAETLAKEGLLVLQDCGINTYNNPDFFSYRSWSELPSGKRPSHYSTFATAIVLT